MDTEHNNPFEELLLALARARVRFVVAGGVAAVLHGVPRVTFDLDIAVDFETKNIERLLSTLQKAGLRPRAPVPADVLLDSSARSRIVREKNALVFTFVHPRDPLKQIDIFLTPDFSYSKLALESSVRKLGNQKVRVISAQALLRMKEAIRPRRDKDELDIRVLRKLIGEVE